MPTKNINWIQLSIQRKNELESDYSEEEYREIEEKVLIEAKNFFNTCTSLAIQTEDLDIELEDDDGDFLHYLVTYQFNHNKSM